MKEAFEDLTKCQHVSLSLPTSVTAEAEKVAHKKWLDLAKSEDSFLRQRSRIRWSIEGDASTAFYHWTIKSRQAHNQIVYFVDDAGNIIDDLEEIKSHAVSFYQVLPGSSSPSSSSPVDIAAIIPAICSLEDKLLLSAPFTDSGIEQAFLSLPRSKSPGPDGYPSEFFTSHWKTVGPEMIAALRSSSPLAVFFSNGTQQLLLWYQRRPTLLRSRNSGQSHAATLCIRSLQSSWQIAWKMSFPAWFPPLNLLSSQAGF